MLSIESRLLVESQILSAVGALIPEGYNFHFTICKGEIDNEEYKAKAIREIVCRYFETETPALFRKTRKREVATTRKFVCYFVKRYTTLNLKQNAMLAGYSESLESFHTYAIHNIKTIENWIETDDTTAMQHRELVQLIQANVFKSNQTIN